MKTDIKSMTVAELEQLLDNIGEKKYRAIQIFRWISGGVCEFDEMTNLPKDLREKLKEFAFIERLEKQKLQISAKDGTRKYLFRLRSGNAIESVFLKYNYGNSVCISSQAGCRMGCSFCASSIGGTCENLSPAEMLDQIISIRKDTDEPIGNAVIMGTGEPFDNFANMCRFLEIVHAKEGINMSFRAITVSTCGIIPKIRDFGKAFPQVNLAVSLHAPNDEIRSRLMPINKKYPMEELLEACRKYTRDTGRRISFEYVLIKGVNDNRSHAEVLAGKLRGMLCHVNLIPLNPVREREYATGDRQSAVTFHRILTKNGVETTIRRELGTDIDGACGQLRLQK
ncbi:MAG TPA: 23S rRNA (adenine(2503)-C(2))-methyltransferase RlmN [Bacillota bacterium]|nr:23S rRNA (adenine(2503)-C(2))-methyltransferase RlmN [Bacillota bacterium]